MVDRCVCCGAIVPEGTQVCINCRWLYMESGNTGSASSSNSGKSKTEAKTTFHHH